MPCNLSGAGPCRDSALGNKNTKGSTELALQGQRGSHNVTPVRKEILTHSHFPDWDWGDAVGDRSRCGSLSSSTNSLAEMMLFQRS